MIVSDHLFGLFTFWYLSQTSAVFAKEANQTSLVSFGAS